MMYPVTCCAVFLSRPNRFIALVSLAGETVDCHVKNTGRCKELLVPGATVILAKAAGNQSRRTQYDLIAVYKGKQLINMDSQAPNQVMKEWLSQQGLFGEPIQLLRPEFRYLESRLDFYLETAGRRCMMEVKGVTLETEGMVRFPDAPTERGIRHLNTLITAAEHGYFALVCFVIQMEAVKGFAPNWETHAAFGEKLREAAAKGVEIIAMDCVVTENSLTVRREVPIYLEPDLRSDASPRPSIL